MLDGEGEIKRGGGAREEEGGKNDRNVATNLSIINAITSLHGIMKYVFVYLYCLFYLFLKYLNHSGLCTLIIIWYVICIFAFCVLSKCIFYKYLNNQANDS